MLLLGNNLIPEILLLLPWSHNHHPSYQDVHLALLNRPVGVQDSHNAKNVIIYKPCRRCYNGHEIPYGKGGDKGSLGDINSRVMPLQCISYWSAATTLSLPPSL